MGRMGRIGDVKQFAAGVAIAAEEPRHARDEVVSVDDAESEGTERQVVVGGEMEVADARMAECIGGGDGIELIVEPVGGKHRQRAAERMTGEIDGGVGSVAFGEEGGHAVSHGKPGAPETQMNAAAAIVDRRIAGQEAIEVAEPVAEVGSAAKGEDQGI